MQSMFSRRISPRIINRFIPQVSPLLGLRFKSSLWISSKTFFDASTKFCPSQIRVEPKGKIGTHEFRVFFSTNYGGKHTLISPWHHIPLAPEPRVDVDTNYYFYYINEIPRFERKKMEIDTKSEYNPIKQDVKNNKLREFTYNDIPFNYGCIPQTWEDPDHRDPDIPNLKGDNDPLDVVEVSVRPLKMGGIYEIKILGAIALIDEGEIDWKIIAINSENEIATELNDIKDLEKYMPGKLETIFDWFRFYKTTDGKPENTFALDGKVIDRQHTLKVIQNTHACWKKLINQN